MDTNPASPPRAETRKERELEPREGAARQLMATRSRLRLHALRQAPVRAGQLRAERAGGSGGGRSAL
jgi:hypothetical protein